KTNGDRAFVEDIWARRKVGYLLDQIRVNGEKKELVDEVVALAKRYGITTPYTSYLLVPDTVPPVAFNGKLPVGGPKGGFGGGFGGGGPPVALQPGFAFGGGAGSSNTGGIPGEAPKTTADLAKALGKDGDDKKDVG